jgi:choline dehydrogenase-like flavoprotein
MLSGLGPQEQLRAHGIEVLRDSPGVGKNLQEHASTQVKAYVSIKTANQEFNLLGKLKYGAQFLLDRSGYTYTGVGLVRTRSDALVQGRARPPQPSLPRALKPNVRFRLVMLPIGSDEFTCRGIM